MCVGVHASHLKVVFQEVSHGLFLDEGRDYRVRTEAGDQWGREHRF